MESKLDMPSDNFDYPDTKGRNYILEFCFVMFIGAVISVLILTILCHADKIDNFFYQLLSNLVFGISRHKVYSLLIISVSLLFIWLPFVKLTFANIKSTILFRTRKGDGSFLGFLR